MSDEMRAKDPGAIWRDQPGEEVTVNLKQIVSRRTEELSSSTRSEILMSILAALLFVGVMAWRIAPHDRLQWAGFGAVIGWVAISLIWFRRRIWRPESSRPDTVASPGLEYYRRELGTAARSFAECLGMARTAGSGVPDFRGDADWQGVSRMGPAAERAAAGGAAGGLDGIWILAAPPPG